jgi:signal transduction histidine kinase
VRNTFSIPVVPENDAERLQALYRYEIIDTPPEGAFNRVAEMAAKIFNVPVALVSLVDKERVFFKASVGMPGLKETERGVSLCSLAVLQDDPTVFEKAETEPCLLANPFVAGSFGLKFYAGAPLITHDGFRIGTICIIDKKERAFSDKDKAVLQDLAAIVMDEIEIRLSAIKAIRMQSDLLHITAHDLKNPLYNISALAEHLQKPLPEDMRLKMTGMLQEASTKMVALVERIVKLSQIEQKEFSLELSLESAGALAEEVVEANQLLAEKKGQQIRLKVEGDEPLVLDKGWVTEAFDNLINNAVKYSPKGTFIDVQVKSSKEGLYFVVQDEGQGFTEEDKTKMFRKFSRLSAQPTGGETSTGLGLSIVKALVELHKGTIRVESAGKNKGSRFIVSIPPLKLEDSRKVSTI